MKSLYIIHEEVSQLLSSLRKTTRWASHARMEEEHDPLVHSFRELSDKLMVMDPSVVPPLSLYLPPFLEVIRQEHTNGHITGLALTSVDKLLAYGVINTSCDGCRAMVSRISEALCHARFYGDNPSSDEVPLLKILQVLKTLLLSDCGQLLSDDNVWEIFKACFNICFETRLSELLRHSAFLTLDSMVAAIFSSLDAIATKDREQHSGEEHQSEQECTSEELSRTNVLSSPTTASPVNASSLNRTVTDGYQATGTQLPGSPDVPPFQSEESQEEGIASETSPTDDSNNVVVVGQDDVIGDEEEGKSEGELQDEGEFTNTQGVHFLHSEKPLTPVRPYGLACVQRLLVYLARCIHPTNEKKLSEASIFIGLKLVATAMECGAYQLDAASPVRDVIKDDLCRSLFAILKGNNVVLFSHALNNCFLLFEANRHHMKYQFEYFLQLLMKDIIVSEDAKMPFQKRELALETFVMLCCIPHLPSELYVNFDCELYSSNVLETLAKTLSKNVFPTSRLQTTHLLSLQALLAIVDSIQSSCSHSNGAQGKWLPPAAEKYSGLAKEARTDVQRTMSTSSVEPTTPQSGADRRSHSSASDSVARTRSDDNESGRGLGHLFPVQQSLSVSPVFPVSLMRKPSSSQEVINLQKEEIGQGETPKEEEGRSMKVLNAQQSVSSEQEVISTPPLPTADELMHLRQRKKLLLAGNDDFNLKPSKGIKFLEEKGLVSGVESVVKLLVDNHHLNKSMIGEYIGDRRNGHILKAFVTQFTMENIPLVEGLHHFLETFRLPGEAPIISRIMEEFAEHWLESNRTGFGREFVSKDGVYVLCYAIMMLNTDLHNPQVRNKMTIEEFIRNQRMTNDGKDPPVDLLKGIYSSVAQQEFVMPEEHRGVVKDNFTWKTLLRRSDQASSSGSAYVRLSSPLYHQDLYLILWGPAVAALSHVFETGIEESVVRSAMKGFRTCAFIAARYGLSDVFDNITVTLCRFTSLSSEQTENSTSAVLTLGTNPKAQMSAKVMFTLAHDHGNILREGWKNILEVLWYLFKAKLLPKVLMEAEDFCSTEGKISLFREDPTPARTDSGLLSSLFSYNWLMSSEQSPQHKMAASGTSDTKALRNAKKCVEDCHPEELFSESKFLKPESLQEMVKALSFSSQGSDVHAHLGTSYDEESAIFHLELLVTVVIENRDRISLIWREVSGHFHRLILSSQSDSLLKERAIVGLLRIVGRVMSRDQIRSEVLSSLRVLLMLPPEHTTVTILRQISNGIHSIIQANVTHVKAASDWLVLMFVMEACSAGANHLPREAPSASEGVDQSDQSQESQTMPPDHNPSSIPLSLDVLRTSSNFDVWAADMLNWQDPQSFFRSSETLSLVVRGDRWLTRENFSGCVHAVRTFAEASCTPQALQYDCAHSKGGSSSPPGRASGAGTRAKSPPLSIDQQPIGSVGQSFATMTIQFLDLLHTLYTRVTDIFYSPATSGRGLSSGVVEAGTGSSMPISSSHLWQTTFCPLLQGMARLCCDPRRNVRHTAIGYLQRALLAHDLQRLASPEWEACFLEVFFPMLSRLLEGPDNVDQGTLEETRMRAAQLLSKVFLQHLSPLLKLVNFKSLWVGILDVLEKYYLVENSESLTEAVPESLKNMLLVMSTAGLFGDVMEIIALEAGGDMTSVRQTPQYQLWLLSWQRIEKFLPSLKSEIFPSQKSPSPSHSLSTTQLADNGSSAAVGKDDIVGTSPTHIQEITTSSSSLVAQPVVIQLHKPLPVLTGQK